MDNFFLKILDLFKGIFIFLKIDYQLLRAIVKVKLSMDNRRPALSFQRNQKPNPGNQFLLTLFFYSIFGGLVAFGLLAVPSFMLGMIIYFSFIMVITIMTLITDFSSILLDTADNTIILPRPVDSRTLFAARSTHIALYLGQLALALSIVPIIAIVFKYNVIMLLTFIVTTIFSIIVAVSVTNAFYLLLLQFSNEEKLKNIINYFQITMAVFIVGGYQLLPRLAGRLELDTYVFEIQWWHYLLPPMWMASTLEAVHENLYDIAHVCMMGCSIAIPLLATYMVNQYLTPVFSRKLGVLDGGNEKVENKRKTSSGITHNFSRWITRSPIEKGVFELVSKLLSRDRKIKLKIYPAFGYMIVFGLIFLISNREDFSTTWANLPSTQYYLVLIYVTFIVLQMALAEIPYSDDFPAGMIYFITPIPHPGEILSGTLKALFVRLFIPGYLLVSTFVLFVWRASAIDDLLFGFFNNFIMLMIMAMINQRHLPFSIAPNLRAQSGNLARGLISTIAIGIIGFGHYFLSMQPILVPLAIPFQIVTIYFLLRFYKKTSWEKLTLQ